MAFLKINKLNKEESEDRSKDSAEENDGGKEERTIKGKSLKNQDFKDLNADNKKLRKEPKKPWGSKERIWVLMVGTLTVGISAFLYASSRDYKLPGLPRITIPNLKSFKFWGGDTIVIEGSKKDKEKSQKVLKEFDNMTRNLSGIYGLFIMDLSSGYSYGVNENEKFEAASLIKLPVMALSFIESEKGNLNLNEKYLLKKEDKIAGSGSLYSKPAGYEVTYENLIRLMGKQSDNTSFNVLRKRFNDEKINNEAKMIGMVSTDIKSNQTSPKDIGVFFESLWNNNLINRENKEKLLEYLTSTSYEDHLPAGLPAEIKFAHKYGKEVHVVNDAGIVMNDEPYIIVVMSKGIVEKEADTIFPQISKMIYETYK
jgi:beta-lactamase class A